MYHAADTLQMWSAQIDSVILFSSKFYKKVTFPADFSLYLCGTHLSRPELARLYVATIFLLVVNI
jgi:hypothetical protein